MRLSSFPLMLCRMTHEGLELNVCPAVVVLTEPPPRPPHVGAPDDEEDERSHTPREQIVVDMDPQPGPSRPNSRPGTPPADGSMSGYSNHDRSLSTVSVCPFGSCRLFIH